MTATGLVTMTLIGRQKHYQANKSSPIFSELRSITLKTFGLAEVLRDALLPHAKTISYAFVFGSVAKATDTAKSDIDLMVVSDGLSYGKLYEALARPEKTLGRKINPTLYSKQEFLEKSRTNSFVKRVIEQPRIDLIGTIDAIGQRRARKPTQAPRAEA
jgi:predicted nucleotidyltransferase